MKIEFEFLDLKETKLLRAILTYGTLQDPKHFNSCIKIQPTRTLEENIESLSAMVNVLLDKHIETKKKELIEIVNKI